jgi:hypothetical protein
MQTFEVGSRRLGVRWNRPGLDHVMSEHAAEVAADAPANVSVVLGKQAGSVRSKHALYVQGRLVVATPSEGRLVRCIVRALASLGAEPPAGSSKLGASLIAYPDRAMIAIDHRLASELRHLEPRLRTIGAHLIETPFLSVRAATVYLPDCSTLVGFSSARLAEAYPSVDLDDPLTPGPVTLSALVYQGHPLPESRASAVADMIPLAREPGGRVRSENVRELVKLSATARTRGVLGQDLRGLREVLGV